jgi:hypothetical protein
VLRFVGVALVVAAAVVAATLTSRRQTLPAAAVVVGGVSAAVAIVGATELTGGALAGNAPGLVAAAAAIGLGGTALAKNSEGPRPELVALAAVALGVAVSTHIDVATSRILPGPLPPPAARVLVGLAAGTAIAALATSAIALFRPPAGVDAATPADV